jgi:hypothetical protein
MTTIERVHEQLLHHRGTAPRDDSSAPQWIEGHDAIEEKISYLNAETLSDVLIKLGILCDRLEQATVCDGDLFIAKSVRNDLRRLSFEYENYTNGR